MENRIENQTKLNMNGNAVFLGQENTDVLDNICALLLALTPILQHYRGPIVNAGFTILFLIFPLLLLKMLINDKSGNISANCVMAIMPLVLFEIYTIFAHNITARNTAYAGFMVVFVWCIANGSINTQYFFKYILLICKAASLIVILQFLVYHSVHYHIRIIPTGLLLPGSDIWLNRAVIGLNQAGDMYRPSGLFLEPSHMLLYCFPILCILMLDHRFNKRILDASIISIGIVLSTSGMGIAIVAMLWGLYYVVYKYDVDTIYKFLRELFSTRTIFIVIAFLSFLIVSYIYVPFIHNAASRVFDVDTGSSVAISGRVRLANEFISSLSGESLILGVSDRASDISFNMAGFHATLYKWGIIGIILSYWYYARGLIRLKGAYFFITFLIIVISFFSAHTHGTFYMVYYSVFLLNGYYNDGLRKVSYSMVKTMPFQVN